MSLDQFVNQLLASPLLPAEQVQQLRKELLGENPLATADDLARRLVDSQLLTAYQANELLRGGAQALVLDEYTLLEPIGAGGMGQVFRARHGRLKRDVAIKLLPPGASESAGSVERFQREMVALARLEHPHIVIAHDAGETDGRPYLVMQWVDGEDLGSLVKRRGRLAVSEALDAILQAARGIAYAHSQGVIHRDLKPSNLLRDKRGTIKVLDMGLAKFSGATREAPASDDLTATGQIMGTVDFMAPEQAEDTHQADERSDIYSLGCTLYGLLTGHSLFGGDTIVKKILAHRESPIPDLTDERPDISQELAAVYRKMVAKRPDDRFASMTDVIRALESCPRAAAVSRERAAAPYDATLDEPRRQAEHSAGAHAATTDFGSSASPPTVTAVTGVAGVMPPTRLGDHETVAFNKRQETHTSYRPPPAPRRRRHKRGPLRAVLMLLLLLVLSAAAMVARPQWDYLQLRRYLGISAEPAGPVAASPAWIEHLNGVAAHEGGVADIAISADGKRLATAGDQVKTWNVPSLSNQYAFRADGVRQVRISPDGQWLAAAGRSGLGVWNAISGADHTGFEQQFRETFGIAFSRKGGVLATADPGIVLWNVESGKTVGRVARAADPLTQLAFSPDNRFLVSAHADHSLRVWNMSDLALQRKIDDHTDVVQSIGFAAEGDLMASGDAGGEIRLWKFPEMRQQAVLTGHEGAICGLAFLPGGNLLVSAGYDGTVRVWDTVQPQERFSLKTNSQHLAALAMDGDGRLLATADTAGQLDIWKLKLPGAR